MRQAKQLFVAFYPAACCMLILLLLCASCGGGSSAIGTPSAERTTTGKPVKPPPPPPPAADPAIAFVAIEGTAIWLMVMDEDGANQTKVYSTPQGGGRWSPNGEQLAFIKSDVVIDPSNQQGHTEHSLNTINVDGSGLFQVIRYPDSKMMGGIAWSPADVPGFGSRIAYAYGGPLAGQCGDIWLIEPAGGEPAAISETPDIWELFPTWSPDAQRMAYIADTRDPDGTRFYDIWVYDFDNCTIERVAMEGPFADRGIPLEGLDWSRTGDKIAFSATFTSTEIWVVDLYDVANPVQLAADPSFNFRSPSWSPSDSQLVYAKDVAGSGDTLGCAIWKMDADGGNKTPLLAPSGKLKGVDKPDWRRL